MDKKPGFETTITWRFGHTPNLLMANERKNLLLGKNKKVKLSQIENCCKENFVIDFFLNEGIIDYHLKRFIAVISINMLYIIPRDVD